MKTTLFIPLLIVGVAAAQPIDWKDDAWYPTNPPKKAYSSKQEENNIQKKSVKMLVDALRQRESQASKTPEDSFLSAYKLIQTAEKDIQSKEYVLAKENLSQAVNCLEDLRKQYPEWGKEIVEYRFDYAQSLLAALPGK